MKFTDEHQLLRKTVHTLVDREINPNVEQWEEEECFPAREVFKKLGEAGLLGVNKPTEYGGMGLDFSYAMVVAEALGRCHCGGVPLSIGVQTDMCTPALARYGSDELRKEFLVPSISGDAIGCIGVSEPDAGSDVAGIRTAARKDGDDYIINGTKMWITNGMQADWMCCLVNTSEGSPHRNKSLIVVPMDAKGIERQKIRKLGMRSSDTAQIFLDDVRVPQRYRIAEEGMGFMLQMLQFQEERLWGSANAVGSFEDIIKETIEYARTRKAFGGPILDNQWVHYKLAEMMTEVEALRALVYHSVELMLDGTNVTKLASMTKLKAGRLSRELTDTCLQFWGGMGYTHENRVARMFRDGRLTSIGGGPDEIMMSIICKLEGILPSRKKS